MTFTLLLDLITREDFNLFIISARKNNLIQKMNKLTEVIIDDFTVKIASGVIRTNIRGFI